MVSEASKQAPTKPSPDLIVISRARTSSALGVSDTILDGITRDSVITIAKDWGMKVEERKVEVEEVIRAAKDENLKDAFGAGTAATIAHIELIGYDGKDYVLPPVETREFSNKILKELNDIKCGKIEDRFNWIYTI